LIKRFFVNILLYDALSLQTNPFLILMKKLSLILLCLLSNIAFGQLLENISFTELPQDFQLFPRDANRNAIIPLKGTVLNRWKTVSVVVFRENKVFTYQKAKITAPANNFNLTPTIKAEKAEYSFKIYASDNDKDSTFIIRQLSNYGEQNLRCLVAVLRFTMEATINQVS
jgi:hypothetical protein